MLIQEIGNLVAHSMDVASVLPMVAFLPLVAALMVATAVADRIA